MHRISFQRVPGQVPSIRVKDHQAELDSLMISALDADRLCPSEAKLWGVDATREVQRHLKRALRAPETDITYFPTVMWNAERF